MRNVRDSPVILDMDIESVGVEIPSHYRAWRDDACLLWQLPLAEGLWKPNGQQEQERKCSTSWTYSLGRRPIAQRLADQLVGPLLVLVVRVVGSNSWDYERHFYCLVKVKYVF